VNLADLRAFVGNLLDYDPTNDTYDTQLDSLLNDAQARLLTDRAWDFCQREGRVTIPTDQQASFTVVNGSATVAGAGFPYSSDAVVPGSRWEGAEVSITDANALTGRYQIRYVSGTNQLFLDRDFEGAGGTYSVTVKMREVYLPSDTATLMGINDLETGLPTPQFYLSKFDRDDARLDTDLLGRPEAYIPSEGVRIPAPRKPTGVAVITPGAGRGARTVTVYMCNVFGPDPETPIEYRAGVSGGRESALSTGVAYTLADNEELTFTPEALPLSTGLYRRYYFTCPELGIKAPVRVRHSLVAAPGLDVDTIAPAGGVTIQSDTRTSTLDSQAFASDAVRHRGSTGVYQSFKLYPHPSSDTGFSIRRLISPSPMLEDQDVPLVPQAYAQAIAYAALEQITLKHDNATLSAVYERKRQQLQRELEARFLGKPIRRIRRGGGLPIAYPNPFGPLIYTP
jgi:hypothetical protein